MRELYEYVASELGGQHYRVSVLSSGDHVVYEGRLSIASPPKMAGRFIERDVWDQMMSGRARSTTARVENPQPQQQQQPSSGHDQVFLQLTQLLFQQQKATSDATLDAVRDVAQSTRELVRDVMQHRDNEQQRGTLAEQLGEFAETSRAVQRLGRAFGAASGGGTREDDTSPLAKVAETAFMTKVAESLAGGGGRQTAPTQVPVSIPFARPIPVRGKK